MSALDKIMREITKIFHSKADGSFTRITELKKGSLGIDYWLTARVHDWQLLALVRSYIAFASFQVPQIFSMVLVSFWNVDAVL